MNLSNLIFWCITVITALVGTYSVMADRMSILVVLWVRHVYLLEAKDINIPCFFILGKVVRICRLSN
jgi:hypothetical protein